MNIKQLHLLIELQEKKEERQRLDYIQAQQHYNQLQQHLDGLSDFRKDYMVQLQNRGEAGITSGYYSQFQAFIGKLEAAIKQQVESLSTAKKVVAQRQTLWLKEKNQLNALLKLAEKQRIKKQKNEQIQEQKLLDEFSTYRFYQVSKGLA